MGFREAACRIFRGETQAYLLTLGTTGEAEQRNYYTDNISLHEDIYSLLLSWKRKSAWRDAANFYKVMYCSTVNPVVSLYRHF